MLLPTSSVSNNNNTCDFIYISLSCDYLIWMSPEPKHAWDVHFTQSLTCFHFLKVYRKHAKHGLFTWYIWSIHIGLLYNHVLWVQILGFRKHQNKGNTCDFIYISLSCDYLIWMSPEPKHAWDVHFTQSLTFYILLEIILEI
jgi:uncharacterized protein with von Willebrand factor type A (vWA) domain